MPQILNAFLHLFLTGLITVWAQPGQLHVETLGVCDDLLAPRPSFKYELAVSQAYLDWRNDPSENLHLASRIAHLDSPAFDGVIISPTGKKIANLSIKGLRVRGPYSVPQSEISPMLLRMTHKAAQRIAVWSRDGAWENWAKHSVFPAGQSSEAIPVRSFLGSIKNLFSVPNDKYLIRTRILISVTDTEADLMPLDPKQIPQVDLMRILTEHRNRVESIVILARNAVWEFRAPLVEFHYFPRE